MMDGGELEFYNHAEQCTGRCISRNTGVSKYDITKFENDMELPTFVPLVTAVSSLNSDPGLSVLRDLGGDASTSQPVFPTAVPFTVSAPSPETHTRSSRSRITRQQRTEKMSDLSSIVPLLSESVHNGEVTEVSVMPTVPSQPVFPTATPVSVIPVNPKTANTIHVTIKQEVISDAEDKEQGKSQGSNGGDGCQGSSSRDGCQGSSSRDGCQGNTNGNHQPVQGSSQGNTPSISSPPETVTNGQENSLEGVKTCDQNGEMPEELTDADVIEGKKLVRWFCKQMHTMMYLHISLGGHLVICINQMITL